MADGHIILNTKVNTAGAVTGAKQIKNAFKGLAKTMAVAFSINSIKNFVKETKSLYQVQAEQETKLAVITKQRTGATSEQVKSLLELASAQQKVGIIGDEVQIAGMQQLATFVKQTDSLEKLLPAMNNLLAQQKGVNATTGDAVNIGNLMGKVFTGQTSALRRVGISFSEAEEEVLKFGNETEKASMLAQVITNNIGNMNVALAQTESGKQKQLANRLGDAKEKLGQIVTIIESAFLPAMETLVSAFESIVGPLNNTAKAMNGETDNAYGIAENVADATANQEALTDAVKETEKAQKGSLAGFDELNNITEQTTENKQEEADLNENINSIGISPVNTKTDEQKNQVANILGTILTVIGVGMLALGILLLAAPGMLGLSLALMISGIAVLGISAVALNWESIPNKTKGIINTIMGILGGAFLVIGIILCCTGHIPIGIALIIVGVVSLVAVIALNWNSITEAMQGTLGKIMAIVGGALLVIGIILVCTGVGIPLGIALIIAGAGALVATVAFNWNAIIDTIKKVCGAIGGVFKSLWDGIKNGFKGLINGIIWLANKWIDGFNLLMTPIRGIIYGVAKAFGSNISFDKIAIPHIPKLANGAVLPANKPFLAQLGDQKNGKNLEAPESLLRQIYNEEQGQIISLLSELLVEVKNGHTIVANDREIARTVNSGNKKLGNSVYIGG